MVIRFIILVKLAIYLLLNSLLPEILFPSLISKTIQLLAVTFGSSDSVLFLTMKSMDSLRMGLAESWELSLERVDRTEREERGLAFWLAASRLMARPTLIGLTTIVCTSVGILCSFWAIGLILSS